MYRGDHEVLDSKPLMEDHSDGCQRVRRARGVRDDVMALRVVPLVIHTEDKHAIRIVRWGRDDDLPCSATKMAGSTLPFAEDTATLQYDVDPDLSPGNPGGILLRKEMDPVFADLDRMIIIADLGRVPTVDGVVFQQVGQIAYVSQIIDPHDLYLISLDKVLERAATDPSESIDPDSDLGHSHPPYRPAPGSGAAGS